MDYLEAYTDGSFDNVRAGWGFVSISKDGKDKEDICFVKGEEDVKVTTNNRMELTAVLKVLGFHNQKNIKIYTDSQLTMNCAQGIFKRKANLDLWEEYDKFSSKRNITWFKVKAHSGNKYNEIADSLAKGIFPR